MSGYTLHGAYSLDDLLAFDKILPEKDRVFLRVTYVTGWLPLEKYVGATY